MQNCSSQNGYWPKSGKPDKVKSNLNCSWIQVTGQTKTWWSTSDDNQGGGDDDDMFLYYDRNDDDWKGWHTNGSGGVCAWLSALIKRHSDQRWMNLPAAGQAGELSIWTQSLKVVPPWSFQFSSIWFNLVYFLVNSDPRDILDICHFSSASQILDWIFLHTKRTLILLLHQLISGSSFRSRDRRKGPRKEEGEAEL